MLFALLTAADPAAGAPDVAERVAWATDAGPVAVTGRVILEGADGGVLLEGVDGAMHAVAAARLTDRAPTGDPFARLGGEELAAALAADLGPGAEPRVSPHFAVASNAAPEFTDWAVDLLEAVFAGFTAEFAPPAAPPGPLPVLILRDRAAFEAFASRPDQAARGVNPGSVAGVLRPGDEPGRPVRLRRFADGRRGAGFGPAAGREPAGERGHGGARGGPPARLQHRPAHAAGGQPGLADGGPRHAGRDRRPPGRPRLERGSPAGRTRPGRRRSASRWPPAGGTGSCGHANPLPALVATDDVFADPAVAAAAYAASWAVVKHLREEKPEAFAAYLSELASAAPLAPVTPEERLEAFRRHFGEDSDGLWDGSSARSVSRHVGPAELIAVRLEPRPSGSVSARVGVARDAP